MTWFCLLKSRFLGLVTIYLVVGSAYQYFGKQERGVRILPNYEFWMAFAGYVWVSILIPEYREKVYRCSHTEPLELLAWPQAQVFYSIFLAALEPNQKENLEEFYM